MKSFPLRVAICAGGTGGHVNPAISVASYLQSKQYAIDWYGRSEGFERKVLKEINEVQYKNIGFSRKFWGTYATHSLIKVLHMIIAFIKSLCYLMSKRPSYMVVFGSYITLPSAAAAIMLGIPIIVHEQNAVWGKTNRFLAPFATKRLTGFETQTKYANQVVVGNPLHYRWMNHVVKRKAHRPKSPLKILVLGGSQGAQSINQLIERLIEVDSHWRDNFDITWQTGHHQVKYATQPSLTIKSFIDDMLPYYTDTDLLISRSGAMTVSEALFFELPAIFIPYPYAIYQHQYHNAKAVAENAPVVIEPSLCVHSLISHLSQFKEGIHPLLNKTCKSRGHRVSETMHHFLL